MKIYSWNVNGLRSAAKKGFFEWLESSDADVIFLQEVRALPEQLEPGQAEPLGWHTAWHPAEKKGYSGVALYARRRPDEIQHGLDRPEFDTEGRFLAARWGNVWVAGVYFPNSQAEGARLGYKLAFCESVAERLEFWKSKGHHVVVGGDFNIAPTALDLTNPKSNEKNPGFLPEERAWMASFLSKGWHDAFRHFVKEGGHYTWWSNRAQSRERNIGWRIDCHCISPSLLPHLKGAKILSQVLGSDHCPIAITLENV